MSDIVWEDPPATGARKQAHPWHEIVAELTEHPGKWALIATGSASSVTNWQQRMKILGCETRTAGVGENKRSLYARWPGEAS